MTDPVPDTKLDEAIALAKKIENLDPYVTPYELELAAALLDATAPGAQYRAGMEAACEAACSACVKEAEACLDDIVPLDVVGSREAHARSGVLLNIQADIRAAIAALPASPEPAVAHKGQANLRLALIACRRIIADLPHDVWGVGGDGDGATWPVRDEVLMDIDATLARSLEPAPVAMPELRWDDRHLLLGQILVGWVEHCSGDRAAAFVNGNSRLASIGIYQTDLARTAVEAAVRERLGRPK